MVTKPYIEDAFKMIGRKFNQCHGGDGTFCSTGDGGSSGQNFADMSAISGGLYGIPSGDQMDTVRRWHNGGDVEGIQKSSRAILNGSMPRTATWEDRQAKFMLTKIKGGETHSELHRGMAVDAKTLGSYKKGGTFLLPVSSFSKSPATASKFASLNAKFQPGTHQVLIKATNSKGFDLSTMGIRAQGEVLVAGKFKINRVSQTEKITTLEISPA